MSGPQFLKATIVIPVRDIHETLDWYQRVLGLATRYVRGKGASPMQDAR